MTGVVAMQMTLSQAHAASRILMHQQKHHGQSSPPRLVTVP